MRALRVGLRMFEFHRFSAWNWRSLQYGKVLEPVAFFVFLTAGFETLVGDIEWRGAQLSYIDFVFPGILALIATRLGVSTISDVSNDRKWGVFAAASTRGQSVAGYVLSLLIYSCIFYTVVASLILLIKIGNGDWQTTDLWAILVGFLVVVFWTSVGLAGGALISSYHARDLVTSLTMLPLILSAPMFYDLDGAAPWLRVIGSINPLTYHVELLRAISTGAVLQAQDIISIAVVPMVMVAAVAVAGRVEPLSTARS